MKRFKKMGCVAALFGVALAMPALAQPEQWLEYHVSREAKSYRVLDLSTNPPPNLVLPKLNDQPFFARWTTPMDTNGGRWICFDRTRKKGPYNRVFVDINGNGRLDDKTPIDSTRADASSAHFDPIRVTFKGEDGPVAYHFILEFYKYESSEARMYIASAGSYEGKVDFSGKKRRLELIDGNVNGVFNDRLPNTDCDRVSVDGSEASGGYLGRLLEVDKEYYRIEVARDGAFVKLSKADDIILGQVRVPETISEFNAVGENGQFVRKPVNGEFSLPLGKYKIYEWKISRKDAKGAAWELSGFRINELGNFKVVSGKPTVLQVGEPIRASVVATENSTNPISFNLNFEGRFGESIQFLRENSRPRGPKLTLASPEGKILYTNTFEFG